MTGTSNLDEYTVVRSDNRDVERTQLNKILRRLASTTGAAVEWGDILGTLADQLDLKAALDNKANATHVHSISDVTGLQDALDELEESSLATGILYGGIGSVDGGVGTGTTVSITAGRGIIIDNTTPSAPTVTMVNFGSFTTQALANTSVPLTWWYINSSGSLQQQTTEPTDTQYRTRIFLFRTAYFGGAITAIVPIVNPLQQVAAQLGDLARAIGVVIADGCRVQANGSNLKLTRNSGILVYWGGNYATNPLDPHEVQIATAAPLSFRMILSSGNPGSLVTDVPVGNYESGGVVTAVPGAGDRTTIFAVYQFPSGNVALQYDNTFYTTIAEAKAAITNGRAFTVNPLVAQADGICTGYLVVKKSATDLSDSTQAAFYYTNKFGELGGAGASAEVARWGGIIGTLSDQTDLQTALNGKANTSHTHAIADVTGLQTALDAKQGLDTQLTSLAALSYTGNAGRVVAVNSGETGFELVSGGGGGGSALTWTRITGATSASSGNAYLAVISSQTDLTLPSLSTNNYFIASNSGDSTANLRIVCGGSVTVNRAGMTTGDNILVAPGETCYLVAESSTELDIV